MNPPRSKSIYFRHQGTNTQGQFINVSQHGLFTPTLGFIDAQAPVVIGEEVLLVFKLKRDLKATKLRGEIALATRGGIGIEFTEKGPQFDEEIRAVIQRI